MPTLGEYAHGWLLVKRRQVRQSTLRGYRQVLNKWLLPALGDMPLDAVKTRHVEAVLADIADHTWSKAREAKAILRAMYNDAIRWEDATHNPARHARLPSDPPATTVDAAPTLGDAYKLAAHMGRYGSMVIVAAITGLRWGELAALTPADINPEANTVTVTKQRSATLNLDGPPKTPSSVRTVVALPEAADLLRRLHTQQSDRVWVSPTGRPLHYQNWRRSVWLPARQATGLPWRFHDFRHTYATILIMRGVPAPLVARMLGHSSPQVTLNVYTSWFDDPVSQVTDLLQRSRDGQESG